MPCAVEDRSMVAVTHLALLGVKIQDAAFWGNTKEKSSRYIRLLLLCKCGEEIFCVIEEKHRYIILIGESAAAYVI